MGIFGPPNVTKLEAKRDLKGLVKALAYPKSPRVRQDAAKALGRIGDGTAVSPLIETLEDDDRDVCQSAASALGALGPLSVGPLIDIVQQESVLGRPTRELRLGAIRALSLTEDPRALELLVSLLEKPDRDRFYRRLKPAVIDALGSMGRPAVDPLISLVAAGDPAASERGIAALERIGLAAVDPLMVVLESDKDAGKVAQAAHALGKINDRRISERTFLLLEHKDAYRRAAAASLLGELGAADAVQPLLALLQSDKRHEVSEAAIGALGQLRDPRAVAALIERLDDERLCFAAAHALGDIGDAGAVEPLVKALQAGHEALRREAAGALGAIGDTRAAEPLLRALRDKDQDVSWAAEDAIRMLGDERTIKARDAFLEARARIQPAIDAFRKLPFSQRICPQCRIDRNMQVELEIIGERPVAAGVLDLECPECGHRVTFIPE